MAKKEIAKEEINKSELPNRSAAKGATEEITSAKDAKKVKAEKKPIK